MKYLGLLLIIFSFSCRSVKQSPVITNQKDSVVITKIITEYKELKDTILIINPCDSNGILKPFRERIKGQQGEVIISEKKRQITGHCALLSLCQIRSIQNRI